MRVIALTGGIGCGKSLAAEYFADLGALVIDADQFARAAIERGTSGFDEVVAIFGDSILKNGEIDRRALGEVVFRDPDKRAVLEAIIHPWVRSQFEAAVASLTGNQTLIYEIPLLFESHEADRFETIITVEAELDKRIGRLRGKGLQLSEIEARIAAQASREDRTSIADFVLENSGSKDDLLRQVENIWQAVTSSSN